MIIDALLPIAAFYFGIMVPWQAHPVLIGHYEDWETCESVREWVDHLGFETDSCDRLPYPQISVALNVFDVPREYMERP